MTRKSVGVLTACLLLALQPVLGTPLPSAMGTVNGAGQTQVNGVAALNGTVLYSGDRIVTGPGGNAFIHLATGDQVVLGQSTAAKVATSGKGYTVLLDHGTVQTAGQADARIVVMAQGVTVEPRPPSGSYAVSLNGSALEVVARRGTAVAEASNRTVVIPEGKLMKATTAQTQSSSGKKEIILVAVIAAVNAGVVLGVALGAEPSRTCVSQSGLTCP